MTIESNGAGLRVGLIGYGLGGMAFHAPFISTTSGMRLAAVMTSDATRRRAVNERYPEATVVGDLDALLALQPRLDLISISSPNGTHAPLARTVLAARRHVVVDKPFAGTAEEAREIGKLAVRAGCLAIPFQNRRWDGDFLTLKRLIGDGALGDVYRFESRFHRWRPIPKSGWCRPGARVALEDILYDLSTHLIDQALQLFGPVASVYAELDRRHPDVVTWDDAYVVLSHRSGVRSHLHATTTAGVLGPRFHVLGSRGAYLKHGLDVQEDALRAGVRPDAPGFGEESPEHWGTLGAIPASDRIRTERGVYAEYYAGVAHAVLDGAPPPVAVEEVAAGLEIIAAANRSSDRGVVVAL